LFHAALATIVLALGAAIGCGEESPAGPSTSPGHAVIGPEGGVLEFGELTLTIPPGAVPVATTLSARRIPTPDVEGFSGPWFEVEPTGLRFEKPVKVHVAHHGGTIIFSFWSRMSTILGARASSR